jgi:2',3'-cyclic-nucleotide 2'-phosphodiesterase (5'-nucleotidase family)
MKRRCINLLVYSKFLVHIEQFVKSFGGNKMKKIIYAIFAIGLIITLALPSSIAVVVAQPDITFTILHTNDFHGNLELSGSNPGAARVADVINDVRTAVGAGDVLLMDAGDIMQGSLLSNIQKGLPTIDYYKQIGYNVATLGNHEFDWGQAVLAKRASEAADDLLPGSTFPFVAANITAKVDGSCAGWDKAVLVGAVPSETYTIEPYTIIDLNTAEGLVQVGVIGVGSVETPYITIAEATEGLCFKDPAESIIHYYDEIKTAGADVMVVLSHNGWTDGGYGYGITVYGDQTLAKKLNDAGKPVNLIIGGHSHTDVTAAVVVGSTTVVQAHYAGRKVGRADITYNPDTHSVQITWSRLVVSTTGDEDPDIADLVQGYANDEDYLELINTPVGFTQVDLLRNYDGDDMMGNFIQDAIYYQLNLDNFDENDVDFVFNNPGGIRTDWCKVSGACVTGLLDEPFELTYGMMYQILPFGNQTVVGEMTGAQVIDLLNQSATLFKGALDVAGIRYKFYRYSDALPGPQPWAWGAYEIVYYDKLADEWKAIDPNATYKIATNEFLAPAGQDGFIQFKYVKNITYWGDMLNLVNEWVANNHSDITSAYKGPEGDGLLDGRITRNGTNAGGDVIPITILHHNDSHGRLLKSGSYQGYTQLVTLINQQRQHNPNRTLLVSGGDNIQGDSMMYYFKSAGLGYASDGTKLPPALQINPLIKAFNAVGYDAMTIGNHEYNFGAEIFSTLADANFPLLQANIIDDGSYGIAQVPVLPYVTKTVGPEAVRVAILGIGNHRVPSYELPSNIPGLSFTNPIDTAAEYAPMLAERNDVVIALTHIGFTTNPASVEVDENVDTFMAQSVDDIDVIIGSHSHTRPDTGFGDFKFLPTILGSPDASPVLVSQAYRYNTYLGQVVVGVLPKSDVKGAYEVVSQAGRYIGVDIATVEDPTIKAIVDPYATMLSSYNNTVIGQTTIPIDALLAFTQETNGANLQADAAVWKLIDEGIDVDFHLSGAMTNSKIAAAATIGTPYDLKVSDMFTAMPYENSLVVMEMNGPQLKAVLERAYRNYYYYKYVPGYGGYSYYTTCMLDTNADNNITYWDKFPEYPDGHNVVALTINGVNIDFTDADTYYNVSSVNYLAAGACNFSDSGKTLWPLDQIVADTQYYVRDAVIEYVTHLTDTTGDPIHPIIEGRLIFNIGSFKSYMPIICR